MNNLPSGNDVEVATLLERVRKIYVDKIRTIK